MRYRKHMVYAAVLIILLGYYAYFEVFRAEQREQKEEADKKVFALEPDTVDHVALSGKDRPKIVLTRGEEKSWRLQSPVESERTEWKSKSF